MDGVFSSQKWFLLIFFVVMGFLFYLLSPILMPFLVGALLAYLSDPLADRLEERGLSRSNSVILVFIALTLIMLVLILLIIPKVSHQVQLLLHQIPALIELIQNTVIPAIQAYLGPDMQFGDLEQLKALVSANWVKTGDIMTQLVSGVTKSGLAVVGWLANVLLIPVVTFYLLRDWDVMMAKLRRLMPRNIEPRVMLLARESDEVLGAFIKGQLLVMLALGCLYASGLWLIGVKLALLLGMLSGLASIVPYMGFFVGIIVSSVAAYMQFQDPIILVWVAVVFGVGQALEGMVLTPLLVGDKIGLHPVAVIFAIMAGGQLFGFVGVLVALPVAAVVMVFLRHFHDGYKKSQLYGVSDEKDDAEEDSVSNLTIDKENVANEQC